MTEPIDDEMSWGGGIRNEANPLYTPPPPLPFEVPIVLNRNWPEGDEAEIGKWGLSCAGN